MAGHSDSDIGYNFAVTQAGGAWDLRGLRRVGAHSASPSNPDANYEWIGVLFILGDEEEPTHAMIEAFRALRFDVILDEFPHATAIRGHQDVPGAQTACPGPYVLGLIDEGVLTQRPETGDDEDMPTAEEIAQAVWSFPLVDPGTEQRVTASDLLQDGAKARLGAIDIKQLLTEPLEGTHAGRTFEKRPIQAANVALRAFAEAKALTNVLVERGDLTSEQVERARVAAMEAVDGGDQS